MENLLPAVFRSIQEIAAADMKITGRVRDHDKVPVIERVACRVRLGDADIDVHKLCERPQVVPVIVRRAGGNGTAGDRPCCCKSVPGNAAAREKQTQPGRKPFLDIDVILRTVAGHRAGKRQPVPDFCNRRAVIKRCFSRGFDMFADDVFHGTAGL